MLACELCFYVGDAPPKDESGYAFLAHDTEGRTIGYAATSWMLSDENQHVAAAYVSVAPDARRRGLGSALLREVIGPARKDGRTLLTGSTSDRVPNTPMHLVLQTESEIFSPASADSGHLYIDWVSVYKPSA